MHSSHELEARGVIRDAIRRLATPDSAESVASLRGEVDRLREQNEKLKKAMRHCTDCEYRIEVVTSRSEAGQTAAGDGDPLT